MFSAKAGTNLWMGNNPDANRFYMPAPTSTADLNEYERAKQLGEEAESYILGDPAGFVLRTIKKAALLHMGETIAVSWNAEGIRQRFGESTLFPLKLFTQASWTALLFLGLTGLVAMIRKRGLMATLAAVAMMALLKRTHPSVVGDRT